MSRELRSFICLKIMQNGEERLRKFTYPSRNGWEYQELNEHSTDPIKRKQKANAIGLEKQMLLVVVLEWGCACGIAN